MEQQEQPAFVTLDDGVRLAYRLDGPMEAPALALVNSLGADLRMWEPQVAALTAQLRVIRYDARGHGRSDAPEGPYSIDRLGQDLLALLDHLGPTLARQMGTSPGDLTETSPVHLCGLSLGGLTAQWLAAHYPERVGRVVLANTASRIGAASGWQERIDAVRSGGMAVVREAVVARFLSAAFRAAHPEETRAVGEMLVATDPVGYVAACAALRDADLRAVASLIKRPTLIVTGGLDEVTPPAQSDDLRAAIAGSASSVLPAAGHLSNIEQPAAFSALVLSFLTLGTSR